MREDGREFGIALALIIGISILIVLAVWLAGTLPTA